MVTRTVSAVAALGVADALAGGPRYYTDLAGAVGADRKTLHRALRLLASVDVFAEPSPGTYALTPVFSACCGARTRTSAVRRSARLIL